MRFKNFNSFLINEELEIHKNVEELLDLLAHKKNKVAQYILAIANNSDLIKLPNDFIDFGKDLNELSFIASNRVDPDDYPKNFTDTRRQSIRAGRLIRKIISDVPKDINSISYTGQFYIMGEEIIIPDDKLPKNYDKILDFLISIGGTITVKGAGVGRVKEKEDKKKKLPEWSYTNSYTETPKKFKIKDLKDEVKVDQTYTLGWHRVSIDKNTASEYGFLDKLTTYLTMNAVDPVEDVFVKVLDVGGNEIPTTIMDGTVTISSDIVITDADIEKFVNEFLALRKSLNFDASGIEFKIVEGEDIRKYYSYKSYFGYDANVKKGQLWQSCMRYDHCQKYFDIYTENPEQVQMLVLVTADGKLVGRALLWKLDKKSDYDEKPDGKIVTGTFMDRIYTINDSDVKLFINHAIKNDWVYRNEEANICFNDEKIESPVLKVTLDMDIADWFPYIDTLSHYSIDDNYLTNSNELDHDRDLSSTAGAWAGADEEDQDPDYNVDNG